MNSLLPELPKGVFNSFGSPLLYDCIVKLKADEIGAQGDTVADATLLSGGTYISPNEAAKAADW